MLPTEDLFVHVYVLVDDAITDGVVAIPPRPGPVPACSDAEVLTMALVRHLLGRRSEAGWPRSGATGLTCSRACRCKASSTGVSGGCGVPSRPSARLAARCPEDSWQQTDTSALPVRHPSRVRGPDGWTGPAGLAAGFGRDAAHAEWFYGFRLAARAGLGSRLIRGWGIVPAAVNEREVADDLLDGIRPPAGLLLDRGFTGRAFAARHIASGTGLPALLRRRCRPAARP